jgi:hypothetical protein
MWLLDKNVPRQMMGFLRSLGLDAHHAGDLGWGALRNGVLTRTAYDAGYRVLITHDQDFDRDAAKELEWRSDFCVVKILLDTPGKHAYVELLEKYWSREAIIPRFGACILWPVCIEEIDDPR